MRSKATISQVLGRDDRAYRAAAVARGCRVENARHGLHARFSAAGVEVCRRRTTALTLVLRAYGYGEALRPVAGAERPAEANRIVYRRGPLSEWYVNGPLGLEQGFTLQAPPEGRRQGLLTLALTVGGTLAPRVDAGRDGLTFAPSSLRYGGLFATDADGRDVPTWLELDGRTLLLRVDDGQARYPLTIDPFVQQAYLKASNTGAGDQFGQNVAVSGDTVVVGTSREDSNATGVDGDETNNSAPNAGAVYVFRPAWRQHHRDLVAMAGRPPSRPFAREASALRALVRLPTSAAALLSATVGAACLRRSTVATCTSAAQSASGWASRYAISVRQIARRGCALVAPCAYTGNPAT